MIKNTLTKYILIDSKYRNSIYKDSSNFRVYLPKFINIHSYLRINYLYMPRTNYLINDKNNLFKVRINSNNGVLDLDVLLPNKNYTPLELVNYINNMFTPLSRYQITFTLTYDVSTYKILFTSNVSFEIDFSLSNFYKLLSLEKKVYKSDENK